MYYDFMMMDIVKHIRTNPAIIAYGLYLYFNSRSYRFASKSLEPEYQLANSMVIAKKAQDPSSPYSQMMQKVAANSNQMANNGSPVVVVSKLILEAGTSKNPNF